MIDEHIYGDIFECKAQIEKDFEVDLQRNLTEHKVLLRGENFPYEKSESSMKRFLTAEDGKTMKPFYMVSPFIDFEDIYAEYHSTVHGLTEEEGTGFLQHYGFPTDLFDLSPSFETARFFACYGRQRDTIGIIGVFLREQMEQYFTITNLSDHPFALRPNNQCAWAGRPRPGIIDLKSQMCDRLFRCKWYRFNKSSADHEYVAEKLPLTYPVEKEIEYFFSRDLDTFVKDHFTYELMTDEQRRLVQEKLETIRGQFT